MAAVIHKRIVRDANGTATLCGVDAGLNHFRWSEVTCKRCQKRRVA